MTPEMRKAEETQLQILGKVDTLTAKVDVCCAALQRVGALSDSALPLCQVSLPSAAPPSALTPGLSAEQGTQLIALLQQLTAQQPTATTGVSSMQIAGPTTAHEPPRAESSLSTPSAKRKEPSGSDAGPRKRRQPSGDTSTAGQGEPLLTLSTLEQYVQAYPELSAPNAKDRFSAVTGGVLNAQRCKAKCFHEAVERRTVAGMGKPLACLSIVQALRPSATMVHPGNLTVLFVLMTRERQSMCAYARFSAGEISDPKTMNDLEFRNALRDSNTLSVAAQQKLHAICTELFGNDAAARTKAKALLANHTPDHCATLKRRTGTVKLWS